jgi:hypothetical protein
LFLEAVPVDEVPPESFFLVEDVIFFEGDIVASEAVFFHVIGHLDFTFLLEFFDNGQVDVLEEELEEFGDFFEVLVDGPAIDGLLEVLVHLDDFDESVGVFHIIEGRLADEHGVM